MAPWPPHLEFQRLVHLMVSSQPDFLVIPNTWFGTWCIQGGREIKKHSPQEIFPESLDPPRDFENLSSPSTGFSTRVHLWVAVILELEWYYFFQLFYIIRIKCYIMLPSLSLNCSLIPVWGCFIEGEGWLAVFRSNRTPTAAPEENRPNHPPSRAAVK